MKTNQVFPSKYLKGADLFGGILPVTIKLVALENMKDQDGNEQQKPVAYFEGGVKPLVLNMTNWNFLRDHYGDESDLWNGKQAALITVKVTAFGKTTDAPRFVNAPKTVEQVNAELAEVDAVAPF
jgi:hypothetical protein